MSAYRPKRCIKGTKKEPWKWDDKNHEDFESIKKLKAHEIASLV